MLNHAKRLLALVLTALMLVSALPVDALAVEVTSAFVLANGTRSGSFQVMNGGVEYKDEGKTRTVRLYPEQCFQNNYGALLADGCSPTLKFKYNNGTVEQGTNWVRYTTFRALKPGNEVITATWGGYTHVTNITVLEPEKPIKAEIYGSESEMAEGTKGRLAVDYTYSNGYDSSNPYAYDQRTVWSSSNAGVLSVDAQGNLTVGSVPNNQDYCDVTITAKAQNAPSVTDSVIVRVVKTNSLTGIEIYGEPNILVGRTDVPFTVYPVPSTSNVPAVTWTSSDPSVAAIDANSGKLNALKVGKTTITATCKADNAIFATFDVTVHDAITKVSIAGEAMVVKGQTLQLTGSVNPAGTKVEWSVRETGEDACVSVDQTGRVTALKKGKATIVLAAQDGSYAYAEHEILVIDGTTQSKSVTYRHTTKICGNRTITIPGDGTEISASNLAAKTVVYSSKANGALSAGLGTYEFNGIVRVGSAESANIPTSFESNERVDAFRYFGGQWQYRPSGSNTWKNLGSNEIFFYCELLLPIAEGSTDKDKSFSIGGITVQIADWYDDYYLEGQQHMLSVAIYDVTRGESNKVLLGKKESMYYYKTLCYRRLGFGMENSAYEVARLELDGQSMGKTTELKYFAMTSDRNVVLYVRLKPFTVTYHADDADDPENVPPQESYYWNQGVTVATSPIPTRAGYTFKGWRAVINGEGKIYKPGESFTMPAHDVDLYAEWAKIEDNVQYIPVVKYDGTTHQVTYAGSVNPASNYVDYWTATTGSTASAATNWKFVGWYSDEACTTSVGTQEFYNPDIKTKATYYALFEPDTESLSGTKTWVDGESTERPTITINLLRDDVEIDSKDLTNGTTSYSFDNLPCVDVKTGNAYTYSVTEDTVDGYTSSQVGNNFTNTIKQENVEVSGTKTWVDGGKTHNNATEITLTLSRTSTKQGATAETVEATPTWEGNTYKYSNLPKYDSEGYAYTYSVAEGDVDGYTSSKVGNNFTNTITQENVEVSGTKTWVDGGKTHNNATEITLTLSRTSAKQGATAETVEATPTWEGNTYKYSNLPKYDSEGYAYTYSVAEGDVDGYTSSQVGNNFTNTIEQTTVSVNVTKVWSEATEITHPTITINLLRDGDEIDSKELENGTTECTFADLPKYAVGTISGYKGDYDGHEFVYTVTENTISGYTGAISGDAANGYTVTNTRADISVDVKKVWAQGSDSTDKSIVVRLNDQNGEVANVTLNAANEWKHTFANLPTYIVVDDAQVEAVYTVTEDGVPGYKSEVSGDAANGFTITNTPSKPSKEYAASLTEFTVNGTANQKKVRIGDEITFTIKWENYTNQTADIQITDALDAHVQFVSADNNGVFANGSVTWTIEDVAAHATGSVSFKATVVKDVIDKTDATIENTAGVIINDYEQNTNTVTIDVAEAGLTLDKSIVDEKTSYALGEDIEYKVEVTNTGNVDLKNVKLTDSLGASIEWDAMPNGANKSGEEITIANLAAGASITFTYSYKVTAADILSGKVDNVATVTADNPTKPNDPFNLTDEETAKTVAVNVELKVEKNETSTRPTDADGYKPGDKVTYSIKVTNNSNVELKNVVVKDDLLGWQTTIDSMMPGDSETFDTGLELTVSEEQALAGKITNTATAEADKVTDPNDKENPITPKGESTVEVPTDFYVELDLEKVVTNQEKAPFKVGETIEYKLTLVNKSNITVKNVVVTDDLTGGNWTVGDMTPGKTWETTTSYTVTEADVTNVNAQGKVVNVAVAEGDPIDDPHGDKPIVPKDEDDAEVETTFEPKLEVVKTVTSTSKNEKGYEVGEMITYEIKVTNTGDVTLTNVKVEDDLTGGSWTIETLEVGAEASKTFKTDYIVTEKDALAGKVLNVATAKADTIPNPKDPEKPWEPKDEDDAEAETTFEPKLEVVKTVTSTSKNEKGYEVGEMITYEIKVTNTGDVTLTNVKVEDDLTGGSWTIETLEVGAEASKTFKTDYIVTEKDALAGKVLNVATAKADTIPNPKDPEKPWEPKDEDDAEVETTFEPKLEVIKTTTSTPANERGYVEGEMITYEIKVTNTGDVTLTNVVVEDDLTGGSWTIETLGVGASETFETSYITTRADVNAGHVLNVATAKSDPIENPKDPENPWMPEGSDDEDNPTRPIYRLTIRYWYERIGGDVAHPTFTREYYYGDGYNVASPQIPGYTVDIQRVKGVITGDVEYDVIYRPVEYKLTIYYIFQDGTTAFPTYRDTLKQGDEYHVDSPTLEGYTVSRKLVAGVMPGRDLVYTVIYIPAGEEITIDEYGVPLGLGDVEMNVGDCFE